MKYGLLTTLRTPIKTITFLLLIAAVTVFLSLGIGMWQGAERMLDEADEVFTTAGEFVFTGGGYPDAQGFDTALAEAAAALDPALFQRDEVLFSEQNLTARAHLPGYRQANLPFADYAALVLVADGHTEKYNAFGARVDAALYATEDLEGTYLYLNNIDAYQFEQGHRYAVFGRVSFIPGRSYRMMEPAPADAPLFGGVFGDAVAVLDITEYRYTRDFLASDASADFRALGDALTILNSSLDVVVTGDPSVVYGFHSGEYQVFDGALFDGAAEGVCVIPRRVAVQFDLAVGDSVTLRLHRATEGVWRFASYHPEAGFAAEDTFTVVGIYQADNFSAPVFVPNTGQSWAVPSDNDYTLARLSLDNRRAAACVEELTAALPAGVELRVYDQGYRAAVLSIHSLRETAALITGLCVVLCALTLYFFGFLFVGRGADSAGILLALGAGKRRVLLYFLSGGGLLAAVSALLGALGGYWLSDAVFRRVYAAITAASSYDFRFSVLGYGAGTETFAAKPEAPLTVYLLLAAAVTTAGVLLCLLFALGVVRGQDPRRRAKQHRKVSRAVERRKTPRRAVGARFVPSLPTPSLRYGMRSILRGGRRSLTVPVLFAAMLLFLCVFHTVQSGFEARMASVYDDIPVTLRFSDVSGKKVDGLVVTSLQTDPIAATGFTETAWASVETLIRVIGVVQYADGTLPETPPADFVMPDNIYTRETVVNQWRLTADRNVRLVLGGQDAFATAPEFAFSDVPSLTWAAGYGPERFFADEPEVSALIVSDKFLEKHGVALGDVISTVSIQDTAAFIAGWQGSFYQETAVLAGTYVSAAGRAMAYRYLPGSEPRVYRSTGTSGGEYLYSTYHAAGFLLRDTARLGELKDTLEGFIDPLGSSGRNRAWVVIDDAALYGTVDNLARYITFLQLLYPVILAMVVGIGFLVSHLLLRGRAGEIAILRGLGAAGRTVFLSFFHEQLLLSLLGGAVGVAVAYFALGGADAIPPAESALLALCYYAGLTLAIIHTYRRAALAALSAKED